jgi:TolA-binding protein
MEATHRTGRWGGLVAALGRGLLVGMMTVGTAALAGGFALPREAAAQPDVNKDIQKDLDALRKVNDELRQLNGKTERTEKEEKRFKHLKERKARIEDERGRAVSGGVLRGHRPGRDGRRGGSEPASPGGGGEVRRGDATEVSPGTPV